MTEVTEVVGVLGALTWDPQIRGAVILLVAVLILPGSVYLLLATNMGARIGFLLAVAGLSGWMAVMGIIWMVYGIGLKGREPSWKVREVITGDINASTIDAVRGFPTGWKRLAAGDKELADAQAAVDKVISKPTAAPAAGHGGETASESEEQTRFPPIFESAEDYVLVAGYRKGGDNELFTIGKHKFFFRHSAHYDVLQVRPRIEQPDFGGALPRPVADTTEPITSVVMVRDLGSLRFPPFVLSVSSLIIFGVTCWVLHQRDKEIWAKQAGASEPAGAAPEPEPAREPEPVGAAE